MIFSRFLPTLILLISAVDCQFYKRPGYEPQNVINQLLTPILYATKSECSASLENKVGLCLSKTACLSSGGTIVGSCNFVLACCVYQGTCRSIITANETYFVSPQYPTIHTERLDPPICIFTLLRPNIVGKLPVCQIRVDFEEFNLAPPVNGMCGNDTTDSFIISGATNFNRSGLPVEGLCGDLSNQHLYVDVDPDKLDDPLLFIVNTANEQRHNRKWSIRIQQVPCYSPFRAPSGCLQYYTTKTGTVESFNFRGTTRPMILQQQPPLQDRVNERQTNYFNNMHYGICIAKHPRSCGIKWTGVNFDFGGFRKDVSATEENPPTGSATRAGCVTYRDAGDIGDYVTIPGSSFDGKANLVNRLCGQRFNPMLTNSQLNSDAISFVKPFIMLVHSDNTTLPDIVPDPPINQKGFQIHFEQLDC